jgi:hypothetical protein
MKIYNQRPKTKDASQRAWDYVCEKYGTPLQMYFVPSCKEGARWVAIMNEEDRKIVRPEDLREVSQNREKLKIKPGITKSKTVGR